MIRRHEPPQPGWTVRRSLRVPRRIALFVLLVPLVSGLVVSAPPAAVRGDDLSNALAQQKTLAQQLKNQQAQVAQLATMQNTLKNEIASTRQALGEVNANLATVTQQVQDMTDRIAGVQATYTGLVSQLASLDAQLASLQVEESAKMVELGQRQALLADHIRNAYDADRTSLLETFLTGATFTDALTEAAAFLDIGQEDKVLAEAIVQDQQTLAVMHQTVLQTRNQDDQLRLATAAQKRQLDHDLAALNFARAQLKVLQARTAQALAAQKAAYAAAARNGALTAAALARTERARADLATKIQQLVAAQQSQGNIPSQYNGTLKWPMAGTVSQEFGCTGVIWEPPLGSCDHFHQGIDIVAPYGTPIIASGDGQVLYCGWNYADGADPAWIVVIAHGGGLVTWYAHMQDMIPPGIRQGTTVVAGQVIGYEGDTGHSTGAHLHWAVMLNNTFVNPRLFL